MPGTVQQCAYIGLPSPCDIHHQNTALRLVPHYALQSDARPRFTGSQTVWLSDGSNTGPHAHIQHVLEHSVVWTVVLPEDHLEESAKGSDL